MTTCVYRLHSTIELPLEAVESFLEDPPLPEGIEGVELTRRNNTIIIRAVAPEGAVEKYTPTAQIKGTVAETRVPDEDAEPVPADSSGPSWGGEVEMEQPTKLVEMAAFKGDREAILQNTALQYPMFQLLCELAREAETGTLSAIVGDEEELAAVRIVEGEDRPASVQIVEERTSEQAAGRGVDWRDNKYIR
ncbi:MAG: hypothetical protein ABEJ92_00785 [Halobacteriales archaeon]